MIFPLVVAAVLSIVHFFSAQFSKLMEKYHNYVLSLSSGILIALIFLDMLPEIFIGQKFLGEKLFLLILLILF